VLCHTEQRKKETLDNIFFIAVLPAPITKKPLFFWGANHICFTLSVVVLPPPERFPQFLYLIII
jgi:hypothetical protein